VLATKPIHTSAALPVEIRESLSALSTFLTTIPPATNKTSTLYSVDPLPLLGTPASDTLFEDVVSARFQALPFQDPGTGLVYARARWYDPSTGSFLTPDPMGYHDSSNLYQFAGGDPVNGRDPRGECLGIDKAGRPCGEYARMLPGLIVDVLGLNDLPSTGNKKIDKTIRKVAQAPARASAAPTQLLLTTGEAEGELAYRMERSTFEGEQALDPASLDDALLVTNVMGDAATFIAPFGLLEGELPNISRAGKTKIASTPGSRTNYACYGSETLEAVPATRVKPTPPGRPSWRTSEQNAASEIKSFGFVEQRSFINGKEVPYGTPGSVRPDLTSDAMNLSVDIKNYDLTTPGGRYNLVQNVVGQASSRSKHLPAGYHQGLILDVRGQDVNTRLLNAMVDRIVKKSGGAIRRENVYFLGID
jgi:RHS repeat-associated protein